MYHFDFGNNGGDFVGFDALFRTNLAVFSQLTVPLFKSVGQSIDLFTAPSMYYLVSTSASCRQFHQLLEIGDRSIAGYSEQKHKTKPIRFVYVIAGYFLKYQSPSYGQQSQLHDVQFAKYYSV